jgi:hypothetical protein
MKKVPVNTHAYGVELSKDDFVDRIAEAFNDTFKGSTTVDELLLHPRDAMEFCDSLRHRCGFSSVPDDVILRSLLQRRKNPSA